MDNQEKDNKAVDKLNETNMLLEGIYTSLNKGEENSVMDHILLKLDELGNKGVQEVKLVGAEIEKIKGERGTKGEKGERGEIGKTGERGAKGERGERGSDGISIKGDKGERGEIGAIGPTGPTGKDGKNGKDGKDGSPDTPKQVKEKLLKQGLALEELDGYGIIESIANKASKTTSLIELDDIDYSALTRNAQGKYILGGGSGGGTWGSITGTLSDQTDLQSALDAKQATLVSGTNIKTINGVSLLGSGDIVIDATVTFADLSANSTTTALSLYQMTEDVDVHFKWFSGNTGLYFDESTERIGNGTDTPLGKFESRATSGAQGVFSYDGSNYVSHTVTSAGNYTIAPTGSLTLNSSGTGKAGISSNWVPLVDTSNRYSLYNASSTITSNSPHANASFTSFEGSSLYSGSGTFNTLYGSYYTARNTGSGTTGDLIGAGFWLRNTGAGTVGNMTGIRLISPTNSGTISGVTRGLYIENLGLSGVANNYGIYINNQTVATNNYAIYTNNGMVRFGDSVGIGADPVASAILQSDSTTKGFLPPRMTTTQKNAISSPATGLVVYDTTLNKLAVYTGAGWEVVTSL